MISHGLKSFRENKIAIEKVNKFTRYEFSETTTYTPLLTAKSIIGCCGYKDQSHQADLCTDPMHLIFDVQYLNYICS